MAKNEYTLMFNSISETIIELEEIISKAYVLLTKLKSAQAKSEEIYLADGENEGEADN